MRCSIACLAVAALVVPGCGGGGGGGGGGMPANVALCTDNFRTPNYAGAIDPGDGQKNQTLTWSAFPVPVYKAPHHVFDFVIRKYDTNTIAKTALDRWVDLVPKGVTYKFVAADPEQGMSITYNRLSARPGAGDALGVTTLYFNASTGVMHKADTVINYWDGIKEDEVAFGLLFTTTHEFGHALFINGHSPYFADTMYFAASTVETKAPTQRDANTLSTAYCGTFNIVPLMLGRDHGPYTKVVIRCVKQGLVLSFP